LQTGGPQAGDLDQDSRNPRFLGASQASTIESSRTGPLGLKAQDRLGALRDRARWKGWSGWAPRLSRLRLTPLALASSGGPPKGGQILRARGSRILVRLAQ